MVLAPAGEARQAGVTVAVPAPAARGADALAMGIDAVCGGRPAAPV